MRRKYMEESILVQLLLVKEHLLEVIFGSMNLKSMTGGLTMRIVEWKEEAMKQASAAGELKIKIATRLIEVTTRIYALKKTGW